MNKLIMKMFISKDYVILEYGLWYLEMNWVLFVNGYEVCCLLLIVELYLWKNYCYWGSG